MGFLDEVKSVADDFKDEFDNADNEDRLLMRVALGVSVTVGIIVLIGVLILLAKIAFYLIPGLVVAGGVYWYFTKYNKGDKDKPDFRKN